MPVNLANIIDQVGRDKGIDKEVLIEALATLGTIAGSLTVREPEQIRNIFGISSRRLHKSRQAGSLSVAGHHQCLSPNLRYAGPALRTKAGSV